jgi:hypothetical protein
MSATSAMVYDSTEQSRLVTVNMEGVIKGIDNPLIDSRNHNFAQEINFLAQFNGGWKNTNHIIIGRNGGFQIKE